MVRWNRLAALIFAIGLLNLMPAGFAQQPGILGPDDLSKVVPTNFYFEGQVGPTQMRNSAAVRFGSNRHFVAALVDTSGYASNIRGKYEGFLITDEAVTVGGVELKAGAYGFGFTDTLKFNIFDVGGRQIHSCAAAKDEKISSPRPLAIVQDGKSLRLYRGRSFVALGIR